MKKAEKSKETEGKKEENEVKSCQVRRGKSVGE